MINPKQKYNLAQNVSKKLYLEITKKLTIFPWWFSHTTVCNQQLSQNPNFKLKESRFMNSLQSSVVLKNFCRQIS